MSALKEGTARSEATDGLEDKMANRVLVGVVALLALLEGFVPGVVPMAGLIIVLAGIVYGALAVDAEDATAYLVVALAASGVAGSGVLGAIPAVGEGLTGLVGGLSMALWGGAATVVIMRTVIRLKG